jgi:hypothetical protein
MTTEPREPSEQELRAAYEAEIKRLRVEHVLLDNVVALANLGMRRTGLAPGTEGERDPAQVRLAIEAIRSMLPLLEQSAPDQISPIRDALSQLQMAYVRIGGEQAGRAETPETGAPDGGGAEETGAPPPQEPPAKPGEPGPAQRSGRLWVPGQ